MADVQAKQVGADVALPGVGQAADQDLRGYVPKIKLAEKSPYVKDKQGVIWHREPWMEDMGDVLEPCWEAPPKAPIVVATSPLDVSHYGRQTRQAESEAAPRPEAKSPSVQTTRAKAKGVKKRRSSRARSTPRAPVASPTDGNAE